MNVKELILKLQEMPQDAEVLHLWDGQPRTAIELVWLSKGGYVVTSDFDEVAYSTDARPLDAPTAEEDRHWKTPQKPENDQR